MKNEQRIPTIISCRYHSHKIRVIHDEHGEFWFLPKDACAAIGIEDHLSAMKDLNRPDQLDAGTMRFFMIPCPGGVEETVCVNLRGLKSLVFRSDRAQAGESKEFLLWIKEKLLPRLKTVLEASDTFEFGKGAISPPGGSSPAVNVPPGEEEQP